MYRRDHSRLHNVDSGVSQTVGFGAGQSANKQSSQRLVPKLWALASGKGGVGKSVLSANLAWLLAESDWATTAVDFDFQGSNLHTYLGLPRSEAGLGAFFRQETSLESLLVRHETPGLSLLSGCANPWERWPSAAACQRFLTALRELDCRAAVIDLPTGASASALDLFIGADLPLLVVTPDPASIENAYCFLKGLHLRLLKGFARRTKSGSILSGALVELPTTWRPFELLSALDRLDSSWAMRAVEYLKGFQVNLVMNHVRSEDDIAVGFSVVRAIEQAYGLGVRFMGALPHEAELWMPLRRRQVLLRDCAPKGFLQGLSQIADHGVEGGALVAGEAATMSAAS